MINIIEKKEFYKEYVQVHERLIARYASAIMNDAISDRGMMQRIMERAFDDIDQVDNTSDVLHWLYLIASDEIIKARNAKNDAPLEFDIAANRTGERNIVMWIEREIEIALYQRRLGMTFLDIFEVFNQMDFSHKLLVLMRYMAGLRKSEIAFFLNLDPDPEAGPRDVSEAIYYSLAVMQRHCGGVPAHSIMIAKEWPEYGAYSDDDDESENESEQEKQLRDVIKAKVAQEFRENPNSWPLEGYSATQRDKTEFNRYERALMDRIKSWINDDSPKCSFPAVDFAFVL